VVGEGSVRVLKPGRVVDVDCGGDITLDAAVSRVSLEPAVSSVSWAVVEGPGAVPAAGQ
jgi:hypothetical protein